MKDRNNKFAAKKRESPDDERAMKRVYGKGVCWESVAAFSTNHFEIEMDECARVVYQTRSQFFSAQEKISA